MRLLLLSILLFTASNSFAQEILGVVVDSITKEPFVNATVTIKQGRTLKSTITDLDGRYTVKGLLAGNYTVTARYISCKTKSVANVVIAANEKTQLNFSLLSGNPNDSIITQYKKPLVDKYKTNNVLTTEELKNYHCALPGTDPAALTPTTYKKRRGGECKDVYVPDPHIDARPYPFAVDHHLDSSQPVITYIKDGVTVTGNASVSEQHRLLANDDYSNSSFNRMKFNDNFAANEPMKLTSPFGAQTICGMVTDVYSNPIIYATIRVSGNSVLIDSAITGYDGTYSMKPIKAGNYNIAVINSGYRTNYTNVTVAPGRKAETNVVLSRLYTTEIQGLVANDKKEPIINAVVQVRYGGILKDSTTTDFDGRFSSRPLDPGYYDVTVTDTGYQTTTYTKVIVVPGERTGLYFKLQSRTQGPDKNLMILYKKTMIFKN